MNEQSQNVPELKKWVPLPMEQWSAQERWVWDMVSTGKIADFNDTSLDFNRDGRELKPENEEDWKDEEGQRRLLRPTFLETILLYEPWRGAIPRRGVRIRGALFQELVNLCNAETVHELWLDHSRFTEGLAMNDARLPFCLSFAESCINKMLHLERVKITGDLFLRQVVGAGARMHSLDVGGQLDMEGARFSDDLAMDDARISGSLLIRRAQLAGMRLHGVEVGGQMALTGANILGQLAMDRAKISSGLFLRHGQFANVRLHGAEVGGQLAMEGARVSDKLAMDGGKIMGSLILSHGIFCTMRLPGIDVGGQVAMENTTLSDELIMDGAKISAGLFFRQGHFSNTRLLGVQVEGPLDMDEASFTGQLCMDGAKVGGELSFSRGDFSVVRLHGIEVAGPVITRGAIFTKEFSMFGSKVKNDVFLDGSFGATATLIFSAVTGNLYLAEARFASIFDLTGTSVGAVLAGRGDWPAKGKLKLDGFSYGHLGPMGQNYGGESMTDLPAAWFGEWLGKQSDYTPQPYEQCAKVLREAGQPDKANWVLLAGKVRERQEAWRKKAFGRWAGLAAMEWLVGHGIGQYTFRALWWGILFGGTGALVALENPPQVLLANQTLEAAKDWSWWQAAFYSFDMLLPVLKISKAYEHLVFPQGAAIWFYAEKILGWLLGFFVVAGLTGLTRKP